MDLCFPFWLWPQDQVTHVFSYNDQQTHLSAEAGVHTLEKTWSNAEPKRSGRTGALCGTFPESHGRFLQAIWAPAIELLLSSAPVAFRVSEYDITEGQMLYFSSGPLATSLTTLPTQTIRLRTQGLSRLLAGFSSSSLQGLLWHWSLGHRAPWSGPPALQLPLSLCPDTPKHSPVSGSAAAFFHSY